MRFALASVFALATSLAAVAGTASLREGSPFAAPAAPAAAPTNQALAGLELTGIVVIDQRPRFSLRDVTSSKIYWLELNQPEDGLTVVTYDAANSTATVEGRGGSRLLVLKQTAISTAPGLPAAVPAPAPVPQVAAGFSPPPRPVAQPAPRPEPAPANLTPEQVKTRQAETEARMLVSDLMEISMQERARHAEEQRRKAAAGGTATAPQK